MSEEMIPDIKKHWCEPNWRGHISVDFKENEDIPLAIRGTKFYFKKSFVEICTIFSDWSQDFDLKFIGITDTSNGETVFNYKATSKKKEQTQQWQK